MNEALIPDEIILPDSDGSDTKPKGIPLSKIIELRRKNLSLQQIADICKCSKQNIHRRLKDVEEFEDFCKDTAIEYEILQHRILRSIDEESIKKTPMASRVTAIAILEDKKRLVRGQTTERIDTFAVTASLADLERRKTELLERIKASRQVVDVTRKEENKTDENK